MDIRPTTNSSVQEDGAIVFNKKKETLESIQRQLNKIQEILVTLQTTPE